MSATITFILDVAGDLSDLQAPEQQCSIKKNRQWQHNIEIDKNNINKNNNKNNINNKGVIMMMMIIISITMMIMIIKIKMVFTTERLFKIAVES